MLTQEASVTPTRLGTWKYRMSSYLIAFVGHTCEQQITFLPANDQPNKLFLMDEVSIHKPHIF